MGKSLNKSDTQTTLKDLPKYISESLLGSTQFCDNLLKFAVIFVRLIFIRLLPVINSLENNFLNFDNGENLQTNEHLTLVNLL